MDLKIVSLTCPNCGAKLSLSSKSGKITCEYCDTSVLFNVRSPDEQRPASNRTEPIKNDTASTPSIHPPTAAEPVPPARKRKTWLWVLGWIFAFPIPLTILLLNSPRTKNINPVVRIFIVIFIWLIFLAIGQSGDPYATTTDKGKSLNAPISAVVEPTRLEAQEGYDQIDILCWGSMR